MSEENLELVRRWGAAFEGDDDAAFLATLHPEVEWHPFEEPNTAFHGHEGAMQVRRQWLSTWTDHQAEIEALIDEGDDVVLFGRLAARGVASDVEVSVDLFIHFKVRDGKIAYIYEYADRDAALAAAGLPTTNGEIVRWMNDGFNADVDLYDAYWTEDAEVIPAPGFVEARPLRGRDEARGFFDRLREGWRDVRVTVLALEEDGDDVRATIRWEGTGEASHAAVQSEWRVHYTFRNGRLARMRFFPPTDPG